MVTDRHLELPLDPDIDVPGLPSGALLAAVACGGLIGAPARYELALALPTSGGTWPTATFLTNVLGAFLLGVLLEALARCGPDTGWRRLARLTMGTGVLGAFTTYSTLAVEADLLVRGGHIPLALGYALASVLAGFTAAWLGIAIATRRA